MARTGKLGSTGRAPSRPGNIRLGAGGFALSPAPVRPVDRTLPFLAHLYSNKLAYKGQVAILNRPILKWTLQGGYQPVTLDLPAGAMDYPDMILRDNPLSYFRCTESVNSRLVADLGSQKLGMGLIGSMTFGQAGVPMIERGVATAVKGAAGANYLTTGPGHYPTTAVDNWSLEAWVNPSSINQSAVIARNSPQSWGMMIGSGLGWGVSGAKLQMMVDENDHFDSGYAFPAANAWYHVVLVRRNGTTHFYVNGVEVGAPIANVPGPVGGGGGFTIGGDESANVPGFNGLIEEVAVYGGALSAGQIAAHYFNAITFLQGDIVRLTEQGGDNTVLYQGIVEDVPDDYDLQPNYQITLQPMVVQLADTEFTTSYVVPTDIAQMLRDAVNATGNLTWTPASLPLSGILAQVNFAQSTVLDVFEHAKKIAGAGCGYHVDATGVCYFQNIDTSKPATFTIKRGVDFTARRFRSPIGALKNKVVCIGNTPPNQVEPIVSVYSDPVSQAQYGLRVYHPALQFPNVVDQATLDMIALTIGTELNRRQTSVELELPAFPSLLLIGQTPLPTLRYWEPNRNPLTQASVGRGRYSPTYVVTDVELDGPHQKVIVQDIPYGSDDFSYEADRISQRIFLQQLLRPSLSGTVPGAVSGGFFSATVGTLPTLPNNFTGWSLDAQNGLSLYNNGVLVARYGPSGGAGVLQAYGGYQPVDATHNVALRFELPGNVVQSIAKVYVSFSLKPFRATNQTVSGSSSASSSGGTSTSHAHFFNIQFGTAVGTALLIDGTSGQLNNNGESSHNDHLTANQSADHTHSIAHTHNLNAPSALYETGMAQGVHVFVDGVDRTTALGGSWGSGSALDVSDLDVSQWVTATGWHEIQLSSSTLGVIVAQVTTKAQIQTT